MPPGLLLQQCLKTGEQFFCREIVRNTANWSLTGATIAGGGYIVQTVTNVGASQINGLDVQTSYHLALRPGWGALNFALNGAYLLKDATQPYPSGPSYDCAGLIGILCATVNPKWRHTLRTTWVTPENLELSATWRFIGTVSLDSNNANPLLFGHTFINQNTGGPTFNTFEARYPNFSFLDLSGTWTVRKGLELRAGINNVFDKDPPLATAEITASGANNTYETYDTLGRQLFVAFTAKF